MLQIKGLFSFTLLLVISVNLLVSATIKSDDGVLVLTDDNFDEAIKTHKFLFVKMYAPWCGHCKTMAPELARASKTLARLTPPLFVSKLDCTVHKEKCSKYGATGYPTLKFFVDGEPTDYEGGRKEAEIVNWILKKTGPAVQEFTNPTELETFISKNNVVVTFFGTSDTVFKVFESVARGLDDEVFAFCKTEACFKHFGVRDGQVTIFKNFDEKRNDIHEVHTVKSIKEFIKRNANPQVSKFNDKIADYIFGQKNPALFIYRDPSETEKFDRLANSLGKVLNGRIRVVTTGITEELEKRLADYVGATEKDLPCVKIADTRVSLKKYNLEGELTEENIVKFVGDWEAGKLKPYLKSEDAPESTDGPVKILIGKTFKDDVINNHNDVLVEFYAPWCGHCKKLAPIWDELAEKLKKTNPNIVIAKMDSTKNEIEDVSVSGYPTIYFFPGKDKTKPVKYSGERDLKGFMEYLEKNAEGFVKDDL